MSKPNIILTGFMATGKTTVGRMLADQLSYDFIDTDELIVQRSGQKSVADIFHAKGEAAFRTMEATISRELGKMEGLVISTGGQLMIDPANAAALGKHGQVFCLLATPEDIISRLSKDKHIKRPLLEVPDPMARIIWLLQQRKESYNRFTQIETSETTPAEIVKKLIAIFQSNLN